MVYDLVITEQASKEIEDAVEYYDHINPDLGTRFLSELSSVYKKLSESPQLYSFVQSARKSNIRDTKLRSFPYLVVFEIKGKKVMVISVLNNHKKSPFS